MTNTEAPVTSSAAGRVERSTPDPHSRMDLFDGLGVVLRRWYVVVPILLVTAYFAYVTHQDKTREYASSLTLGVTTSSVITQQPVPSGSPTVVSNNALATAGGTVLLSNLLTIGLQDPEVANQVVAAGGSANYNVAVEQRSQSFSQLPIVTIGVTAASAEQARATLDTIQNLAAPVLTKIQTNAGVPTERLATPFIVQSATPPTVSIPSRTRATATVAVVGLLASLVVAALVEAVVRRRRGVRSNEVGTHAADR